MQSDNSDGLKIAEHALCSCSKIGVARGDRSLDFSVQTKRIVVSGDQSGMKNVTFITQCVGYIIVSSAWNTFCSIIVRVFTPCDRFETILVLEVILSGHQRDLLFQDIVTNRLHSPTCSGLILAPQNKHYSSNKE